MALLYRPVAQRSFNNNELMTQNKYWFMEKVNVFFRCLVVATLVVLGACTDYQYVDTGLANGKHDCTVWEYLHSQPDDWDSTIIMIEHAGMKEYFDGSRQNEQITFSGLQI